MSASSGRESRPASLLRRFLEEARPPGLVSAYLYGSHGEGRAHRESDVDVALVLDRARLPTSHVSSSCVSP
jgi:predicted nucleotidyltransferase